MLSLIRWDGAVRAVGWGVTACWKLFWWSSYIHYDTNWWVGVMSLIRISTQLRLPRGLWGLISLLINNTSTAPLHYSTTPLSPLQYSSLNYSITPLFHRSTTPLHHCSTTSPHIKHYCLSHWRDIYWNLLTQLWGWWTPLIVRWYLSLNLILSNSSWWLNLISVSRALQAVREFYQHF